MHFKFFLYIKNFFVTLVVLIISQNLFASDHFPRGTHDIFIAKSSDFRPEILKNITPLISQSIAEGSYPGAVILISHRGHIIYRGVFGNRAIVPKVLPMHFNTIFDLASLTKVVATTPAVMQLVEQNKLDLDKPVAYYWPEFAVNGKDKVTIRELLTHVSGLPDLEMSSHGETEMLNKICQLKLVTEPGTRFIYSDINFVVLAHLVEIVTHQHFKNYVDSNIFKKLKMQDTDFLPAKQLRDRVAPTTISNKELRWGVVLDPIAYEMNGVAGNAGLFSDAHDLGIYAQSLLNGGRIGHSSKYFLSPLTILKMITPQTPPGMLSVRALGWDVDSAYSNRGVFFPVGSFGHQGWTGTSIWIDPATQTWIIFLTSRTHPLPAKHNKVIEDRRTIANIVATSLTDVKFTKESNTSASELSRVYHMTA